MDSRSVPSQPSSRVNISPTIVGEPITWVIRRSTYKTEETSDGLPIFNHSGFRYKATAPGAGSISWHIKCVNYSDQNHRCFVQGVRHKDGRLLMLRKHNHSRMYITDNPTKRRKKSLVDTPSSDILEPRVDTLPLPPMDIDLLLPIPPPSGVRTTGITARYLSTGSTVCNLKDLFSSSEPSRPSTPSAHSGTPRSTPPSSPPSSSVKTPKPSAMGSIAPASSVKTTRSSTKRSATPPPSAKTPRSSKTGSTAPSTPPVSSAKITRSSTTRSNPPLTPPSSPAKTRRSLTKSLNLSLPPTSAGKTSKSLIKVLNSSAPVSLVNGKGHTKSLRETRQPRSGRRQKIEEVDSSLLSRMQSRWKAARRKSTLKTLRSAVEMACL